jgi:hypothetical protein
LRLSAEAVKISTTEDAENGAIEYRSTTQSNEVGMKSNPATNVRRSNRKDTAKTFNYLCLFYVLCGKSLFLLYGLGP